ncbi:MAG: PadR family transcriptional regulator [Clostridia bacterium]|nr:PadR family transcriptional regulator [Clostridia bacterium]
MDTQLRKGILDVCVLMAIKNEDSYGYKIIKDLSDVIKISESTLYTILKRLEEGEMLIVRSTEYEGRIRKYYHITQVGIQRIEEFKKEWGEIKKVYAFITGDK